MSVRLRILLLVLCVLASSLAAAAWAVGSTYAREKRAIEQGLRETARALSLVVDRELGRREAAAWTLATSPSLRSGDRLSFHDQAVEATSSLGGWVVLFGPNGMLVNTSQPAGAELPRRPEGRRYVRLTDSGATISDLFQGPATGRWLVALSVPVRQPGLAGHGISIVVLPEHLQKVIDDQRLPQGWIATVVDRQGRIVARQPQPAKWIGHAAPADVVAQLGTANEGFVHSRSLEGTPTKVFFSTSPNYKWGFVIGVPEAQLGASLRRSAFEVGAVALVLLALSTAAAAVVGRKIAVPARRLQSAAEALKAGTPIAYQASGVSEFDIAGATLADAGTQLIDANRALERREHEREALLQTLGQTQARLLTAQRISRVAYWELELASGRITASELMPEILGHEMAALQGGPEQWLRIVHADDRERVRAAYEQAVAGQAPLDVELRVVPADGGTVWVHSLAELQRAPDGTPLRLFGSTQDITERKQAERRSASQLARMELLDQITRAIGDRLDLHSVFQVVTISIAEQLQVALCAIALYDRAGDRVIVNAVAGSEGLAERLGLVEQAQLAVDHDGLARCMRGHLVYEPDLLQLQAPLPQRLAEAGLHSAVLAPLQTEGQVFGLVMAVRERSHGFSSGDCEFLRQLSEHVALAAHQAQLHGALQSAYDELRQTQQVVLQQERLRALGEMASGIAHDINNAISPVALYTESLLEKETSLSPRAREQLEIIQRAIDDVAGTVARLREFYRPREAGIERTEVDLNVLVQQVLDLTRARWRDMAQQRGAAIDVATELQDGLPRVRAAEGEIREALTNLVFNAVDAMPHGGTLALRTRALDDAEGNEWVDVEVADSGIGMDEATRRSCLEPFFTTKGERGTGLGLAMVYGTVQRHGAQLQIDSAPGAGTTVRLRFAPAGEHEPPDTGWGMLPPTGRALQVLVVDDDAVLARSMIDILQSEGHRVTAAAGGERGIAEFNAALARGEPFDAVITDLGMPRIDGRQVAKAVKAASPTTPVLMLTGWGRRMTEDGERPPHVDQLLSKPPRLIELRAALARAGSPN
jgi:PAS domain S-box-containing protein